MSLTGFLGAKKGDVNDKGCLLRRELQYAVNTFLLFSIIFYINISFCRYNPHATDY